MSNIIKKINWTSPSGAAIEVKIEVLKSVEKDISYSDGWNIDLGNKVEELKKITVYLNGKCHESTYNNPTIVEDAFFSDDYKAKVKASGGYARLTDRVIINEEKYNLVMDAIKMAELELNEAFEADYKKIEIKKSEEETIMEALNKLEIKRANDIMTEIATRRTEILSVADEKQWRINYNNVNNEGGEGYIPRRATLEDVKRAKTILSIEV